MLTNLILNIMFWAIKILLSPIMLFSDVVADSNIGSSITNAITYLANLNNILPLTTLFTIIGLIISIEIIIFGFKFLNWVFRKIPGLG